MATEKSFLTPEQERLSESPHDRITTLLAELEQEHGPIDRQVIEDVRRAWPAPGEEACHQLPLVESPHRGPQPD